LGPAGGAQPAGRLIERLVRSQDYLFGSLPSESERLRALAEAWAPAARQLLQDSGLRPGAKACEFGCGPIGILDLLAEAVGLSGSVTAIEREQRFAEAARREVTQRHLTNVAIIEGDVRSGPEPEDLYDFAHERLVLINIAQPETLLAHMLRRLRPGGIFAAEEIDCVSWLCHPRHRSWDALMTAFNAAVRSVGSEPCFGRHLPALLRGAGLVDIHYRVHTLTAEAGSARRKYFLATVHPLREQILALNLMSTEAWDSHCTALDRHLNDPETVVIDQLLVQAWDHKPSTSPSPAL
jgi:SAM-dependent methyltransferase